MAQVRPVTRVFLFLCYFLTSFSMMGQEYSYVNYNVNEGLAGSVVYCMAQDQDGFIWFGTETGLSRFDGTRFKNFTTEDGLPDNEILRLFVDSKNRVWIIPFKNKLCYYWNGTIHQQENDSLLKSLPGEKEVVAIVENNKHELAIIKADTVTILQPDGRIRVIKNLPVLMWFCQGGLDFDGSFQVALNIDDNIDGYKGSYLYNISGDSLVLPPHPKDVYTPTRAGYFFTEDIKAFKLVSDSIDFILPSGKFSIKSPPDFVNMTRLNDSVVAVTAKSVTQTINIFQKKPERYFLKGKNISNALQDREGNLWFSSLGSGVYRLPSTNFNTLLFEQNGNRLAAYCLAKKGENLFIGTDNYLLWQWQIKSGRLQKSSLLSEYRDGRVTTISEMDHDELLVGTDRGLFRIADGKKTGENIDFPVKAALSFGDTILVGHDKWVEIMTRNSLRSHETFFYNRITSIFKRNDSVFLGTLNGLYIKTLGGQVSNMGDKFKIFSGRIGTIIDEPGGTTWIATYGGGIAAYKGGKIVAVLNEQAGLTSNIVRTVCARNNYIWVGTDKGLNKVEATNGHYKISRYTTADGLISDIINSIYVAGDTVFVATPDGVSFFDINKVFTGSMCILKILSVQSNKRRLINLEGHLRFDHYEHDIRFEFTGISFKSAGDITYRYRFQGLDKDWQTTTSNFLHYPRLSSGDYNLQLQAVNKFNVASEIITIPFSVEQLFWEKSWVQAMAVLLSGLLIWTFVNYRIRSIRRQEQLKTTLNDKIRDLEQMALRAQMNPHFIFNCLNSIQEYIFDKDVLGANRFITGFSRLIRLTLEISAKPRVTLQEEIDFLTSYLELEKRRFTRKFNYRIQVSDAIDPDSSEIPSMILQPYIENSIRHGIRYREDDAGLVSLSFMIENDYLLCTIEDNGIGREESRRLKGKMHVEYQSKGMSLTAKRIDLMNQNSEAPIQIEIEDLYTGDVPAGTKVILRFPLNELNKTVS